MHRNIWLSPEAASVPESVRQAIARDLTEFGPDYLQEMESRIQAGLEYLLGTDQPVSVLGTSVNGAMYAALGALFPPGEKVLVVEAGGDGLKFSDMAQARGLEVVALPLPQGRAVQPKEIENTLTRWPDISGVLVQAVETGTGVAHPLQEISRLCRDKKRTLVVDGTAAVGVSPCFVDQWGLDCLLGAFGPGAMLPSGLAFVAIGADARKRHISGSGPTQESGLLSGSIAAVSGSGVFKPGVNMLQGLDASLNLLWRTGLDRIHLRHLALTAMVRTGVESMGLSPLAADDYAAGVTAIQLPPGIEAGKLLQIARDDYQVVIAPGSTGPRGDILRIGHMGDISWHEILAGLMALHKSYLRCGGVSGSRDYLERAWSAYVRTMEQETIG